MDFLVANCVVVEIKSVQSLLPVHDAQLLTYLRLTNHKLGLLINFNAATLRRGIKRIVKISDFIGSLRLCGERFPT